MTPVQDLLDDVAGAATAQVRVDTLAARALDDAHRRTGAHRRRRALQVVAAAACLGLGVAAIRWGVTSGVGEAGPASTNGVRAFWEGLPTPVVLLLVLLAVLIGLPASVAIAVGLVAALVRWQPHRSGWAASLRDVPAGLRWRWAAGPRWLKVVAGLLALLVVLLLFVPSTVEGMFAGWSRGSGEHTDDALVVPAVLRDQRTVPPRAFDTTTMPGTRRVSVVFRATVAGRYGTYAVDGETGSLVRLDDLPGVGDGDFGAGRELAVSPNGRFVVTEEPGDERRFGMLVGAMVIDLEKGRVSHLPTLAPPSESADQSRASTSLAVLDDGSLATKRDGTDALWVQAPGSQPREFREAGPVLAVAAGGLRGSLLYLGGTPLATFEVGTEDLLMGRAWADGSRRTVATVRVDGLQVRKFLHTIVDADATGLLVTTPGVYRVTLEGAQGGNGRVLRAQYPDDGDTPAADPNAVPASDPSRRPSVVAVDSAGASVTLTRIELKPALLAVAAGDIRQIPYAVDRAEPAWTVLLAWPWRALALLAGAAAVLALAGVFARTSRPRH